MNRHLVSKLQCNIHWLIRCDREPSIWSRWKWSLETPSTTEVRRSFLGLTSEHHTACSVLNALNSTTILTRLTVMGIHYCALLYLTRHFEDKGHWWTFAKKREVRRWVLTLITGLLLKYILILRFLWFDLRNTSFVKRKLQPISPVYFNFIHFLFIISYLPYQSQQDSYVVWWRCSYRTVQRRYQILNSEFFTIWLRKKRQGKWSTEWHFCSLLVAIVYSWSSLGFSFL